MWLKKLNRDSYVLVIMPREKYRIYYSIERHKKKIYTLEVKLHIINMLVRHFISLIGSTALHTVTIYFYTNLLKATK